jgi:Uncharacterised protein family (UPF0150).
MILIEGYQVDIKWSEEDAAFLVSIPELQKETGLIMPCTHGDTYQEAISEAKISIELAHLPDGVFA